MFYRHSLDKLIYPVVAVALMLVISYRPAYRLQPEMPKTFFPEGNSGKGQKMSPERRIAWGYWESAQMDIQWKYPHGSTLPLDPPAEFRVDAGALGPGASDALTRQLYWHRLQQVWPLPETWKQQYEWQVGWLSDPLTSAGQWLRDHADRWFTIR